MEVAKENGVLRFIVVSFAASGKHSEFNISPVLMYTEARARFSGMEWTILRDGMYIDPVADWVPELMKMGRLPYPVKSGKIAYVSRNYLAATMARAVTSDGHGGMKYDLTGPEAISMPRLAEIISSVTGKDIPYKCVGDEEFIKICLADGENEYITQALVTIYRTADACEFEQVTDHVELLSGNAPETMETFMRLSLKV